MKKRTESQLVTASLKYLQTLENMGVIAWADRCNSGKFFTGKYMIRGMRTGTPDILCILSDGSVLWIECKFGTYGLSIEQLMFKEMVGKFKTQYYLLVQDSIDDITKFLTERGDLNGQESKTKAKDKKENLLILVNESKGDIRPCPADVADI